MSNLTKLLVDIFLVLFYITIMSYYFTLLGFTLYQAVISVAFIIVSIVITILWCNYYE